MSITISKQRNPDAKVKVFYRVKNNGVFLEDFKTKAEATKFANKKRNK